MPIRPPKHRPAATSRRVWDNPTRKTRQALYWGRWRRVSAQYLQLHPMCQCAECATSGSPRAADCVDHIKDHKGDVALFWDEANWQALHHDCHSAKTRRENPGEQWR